MFVYLRDGDRVGATIHRVLSNSVLLLDTPLKRLDLPEGKDILEYRKEREDVGVEFRYRLVSFSDWLSDQDQKTVRKWKGTEEGSVYPPAPEGTFWSEHPTPSEPWCLSLLSLETGEPVEGHEELVATVRADLLAKTEAIMAARRAAKESAKSGKSEPAPEQPETAAAEEPAAEPQEAAGEAKAPEAVTEPSEPSQAPEGAADAASEPSEAAAA